MRILVLGPNGQLGSDVCRAAKKRGTDFEVIEFGRDRVDVSDVPELRSTLAGMDFDVLINCTSFHKTDEVEGRATAAFATNAHAVEAMAQTCSDRGARFLHISTDYVFSGEERATPYMEDDCPSPINVYGASKAMGEALVRLVDPKATILRVASLFGVAGASGKGGNFVETMIRVGRDNGHLRVVDGITMSPTATADVAEMILDLLHMEAPPGVYHAVNSGQATWHAFATQIVARAGVTAEVEPVGSTEYPTIARRPAFSVLDNSKLSAQLGRPIPHWSEALDRYLREKGHLA